MAATRTGRVLPSLSPPDLRLSLAALAIAAGIWSSPGACAQAASPGQTYAERAIMRMADARCHLFDSAVTGALQVAEAQARNAVLRADNEAEHLDRLTEIARKRAAALACNDPVLVSEAARVRSAFSGYARVQRMSFPGAATSWRADRTVLATRQDTGRWALTTSAVQARTDVRFGAVVLAGRISLFAAPSAVAGGPQAASARLVLRDPALSDHPYLVGPLTPPPRAVSRVIFAADRRMGPDGVEGFSFNDAAAAALSALDPREAVVLEFVFPGKRGERISRAVYEVGDFTPAYSFLQLPHS